MKGEREMPFRVCENYRQTAVEIRCRYALKYPELTFISTDYRHPNGLSSFALAMQYADERKLVIIYGLPRGIDEELVPLLQKMPNVRFLDSPWHEDEVYQVYNELRAPWLPHNCRRQRPRVQPKNP